MKYERVRGHLPLPELPQTVALRRACQRGRTRYDLASALRIVRAVETTPGRLAVFAEIKRKNAIYRMVDAIYAKVGERFFQPFALWLYMLKCVLSVGPFAKRGTVVALSNFPNEKKTIERVAALAGDTEILRLSIRRRHIVGLGQLRAAARMIGAVVHLWPFLCLLARKLGFMPAARVASTLAFYIRFKQFFASRDDLVSAILASNYSPEAVALAAAAHEAGRNVIYANHAPVPLNGEIVPPVLSDFALLYGEQTAETYRRRSVCTAEIAVIGQPSTSREMNWSHRLETVGIFLTSGTRITVLSGLIADIRKSHPNVRIIVRDHPVSLLRNNLSDIVSDDSLTQLTFGNPLDEEIASCDLIMCGNSGVALNALCAGRPVGCLTRLDGVLDDYNGFVESGLVCEIEGWTADLYSHLRDFYERPHWRSIMKSFDASYGVDESELSVVAARQLAPYLLPSKKRRR